MKRHFPPKVTRSVCVSAGPRPPISQHPAYLSKRNPEPAKGRPIPQRPCPTAISRKKSPLKESTSLQRLRPHRPGCAKKSHGLPLDELGPCPQNDDAGPLVISRSPGGQIWAHGPGWGGSGGSPEHPSQAGLFQTASQGTVTCGQGMQTLGPLLASENQGGA